MRVFVVLLALALAPSASLAAGPAMAPENVIDVAVGDWNKDGKPDLALLAVTSADDVAIGVYLYLREDNGLLKLALAAPDKVWGSAHGGIAGQEPGLKALPNGSIAITEQNSAIGRDRWEQTRTLAYRNGQFVVAGYTFSSYDTVQELPPLNCDLNLLSGKGTLNGKPVAFAARTIALQDWKDEVGSNPGLVICRKK